MISKKLSSLLFIAPLLFTSACSGNKSKLDSWKKGGAIDTIANYVEDVCNEKSENFIPVEDRIATFDIDGTAIVERGPNNVELAPQEVLFEYANVHYRSGDENATSWRTQFTEIRNSFWQNEDDSDIEEQYHYAQTKFYESTIADLTPSKVTTYFNEAVKNGYYSSERKLTEIAYKPMLEMYTYLKENNFEIYFVSGSFRYALYSIASYLFEGIDFDHCIGTDYELYYDEQSHEMKFGSCGEISVGEIKVRKIATEIGKTPVLAFGNSSGDRQMIQYAISNPKYKSLGVAINHDDEEREYVYNKEKIHQMCESIGALEVSIKNDFIAVF